MTLVLSIIDAYNFVEVLPVYDVSPMKGCFTSSKETLNNMQYRAYNNFSAEMSPNLLLSTRIPTPKIAPFSNCAKILLFLNVRIYLYFSTENGISYLFDGTVRIHSYDGENPSEIRNRILWF